ncbi:hypothetical protein [Kitasatospora nipponensis]
MRTSTLLRAAVPAAALALLLTGCGPDETPAPAGASSAAPSAAASSAAPSKSAAAPSKGGAAPSTSAGASAPASSAPGGPGAGFAAALAPSAQAQGVYSDHQKGDISLTIGPVKVVKGDVADLAKFAKAADLAGKTPYYVSVSYTHTGGNGLFEPYFNAQLRAMVSDTDQAPKIDLLSGFPQCQSDVPKGGADFVKGQTEHECAIYLAPSDKPLKYVLWVNKSGAPLAWKAS